MENYRMSNPYFERALSEHRELRYRVREVRDVLAKLARHADAQTCERLCELLRSLQDYLAAHFAQEEKGGYLEEALSLVPTFTHEATVLEKQHGPLLDELGEVLKLAEHGLKDAKRVGQVCEAFVRFTKSLLAHEASENQIVQAAAGRDLEIQENFEHEARD